MITLLEYKCPSCGGALSFDSQTQQMKCPYCDSELDVESLKQLDQILETAPEDAMDWQDCTGSDWQGEEADALRRYSCRSCGGEILTEATTVATDCPYCDNPVVIVPQVAGALRPDLVIPFRLDKKSAQEALKRHFQGKKLLPKAFKTESHVQEVKGVYVPVWLYDAHAAGSARYRATRIRTWATSQYMYTETTHYLVQRAGEMDFVAVPVDGASKLEDTLMESLEPYDISQAEPFQTAYLAGFYADRYDVSAAQCADRANGRIRQTAQDALRGTVGGYNTVVQESCSVQLSNNRSRYALLPVWLLTTRYKGKLYQFAMNGQTGKLVGDLPVSWGAFWRWWGIITALAALVLCLGYRLLT